MFRLSLILPLLVVGIFACKRAPSTPAPPLGPEHYAIDPSDRPSDGVHIRYRAPDRRAGGLDVATTTYAPREGDGPLVVLVGVVHIADAPYYREIQRELDACDLVLYEGVKDADLSVTAWQRETRESEDGRGAKFQAEIARWFGFEFQLHALDYSKDTFVHADMTMGQFIDAGGEAFVGPLREEAQEAGLPSGVKDLMTHLRAFGELALGTPGPLQSLARKMLAEELGTMDLGTSLDMVPGLSELLINRRNEVVLDTLREELARHADKKRVGIVYGAAHMPDLEARLEKEFTYRRREARWIRAWALRPPLVR